MYFHVILFYDGEGIKNDEIRKQLDALREEVRTLNRSFINLRQDDLRAVMGEQIRPVLVEKVDRYFFEAGGRSEKERRAHERCRDDLIAFLSEAILVFQRDGRDDLARFLDEHEEGVTGPNSNCSRPGCSSIAAEVVGQLRSYLGTFDRLSPPMVPEKEAPERPVDEVDRSLSPTLVENMLGPLSNSWRITVLMLLTKENASLAELSKALGLKKGHLQFHLKTLIGPGYIAYDRRTHLYSVTSKGKAALSGLADLVHDIASS